MVALHVKLREQGLYKLTLTRGPFTTTVPLLASWFHVPMRVIEPEPWDLAIRVRDEPHGVQRYIVASDSRADGTA